MTLAEGVARASAEERLRSYLPRVAIRQLTAEPGAIVQTVGGTIVFVDVSGFTKLSERLARRGREGAELLADAIGGHFSALLAVAYANGGSLLKFGGDALLLLFEGAGHEERGVRSAAAMRRTLREAGSVELGGARVSLRMSVGAHSGEFHLFLVGASHREFIVVGPGASRVVAMEQAADPGDILLSPELCARLPRSCLGAAKGPGRLLARPPSGVSLPPEDPVAVIEEDLLSGCLSTALRTHVLDGGATPEHRTATVAFVHFEGTDELLAREGAGAVAAVLDSLVRTVQGAADEHGVCFLASDVDADGGKLILVSGAPRVVGDDEERMLLALRQIAEAGPPLDVRIGVNRGAVFAGDIGPHYRRTYTVMGDAVNLAARLMAKAPRGEIFATGSVLDCSATRFELRDVEPFMVKGKARPVQAWSVGPAVGTRTPAGHIERPALVGRRDELAALEAAVAAAREGSGSVVEIVGEPGIGKTRLIEELRARAGELRRIEAPCQAYTSSAPYATWRTVLRALLGTSADDDPESVVARLRTAVRDADPELEPWLPLLGIAADVSVPPTPEVDQLAEEFRQAKLQDVVARFLRLAFPGPLLLEVEHAHHMDAASGSLLRAAAADLVAAGWLVALTRREGAADAAPPDESVIRLQPAPLAIEETLELARALTREQPLPPYAMQLAAERSGGNPQFLRDLLRAAAMGEATLPDSIEAAATALIDRLPPLERALVRRASVLGAEFEAERLADVLGEDVDMPGDDGWRRLAPLLVRHGERLRFERAAVREAAYGGLPFSLRRRLHAIAGSTLEQSLGERAPEAAGILSLHFLLAGEHAGAWRYARIAAARAQERSSYCDAVALHRRAIEASAKLDVPVQDMLAVWEALALAHERTGDPRAATAALTEARRLVASDPVKQAELLHRQGLITMDAGGIRQAVRWVTKGLRLLADAPGRDARCTRALLVATLATIRQRQGRMQEAIRLCEQAIADARAVQDERVLARAGFVLDWALAESGRTEEAVHSQRSLDIYRRLGDVQSEAIVLNNLGGFAYREGRWADAVDLWTRAGEASRRCGDDVGAAFVVGNLGELLSDQGRLEEAEQMLQDAMQVFRGTANEWAVAYTTALLGRAALRAQRDDAAAALLAEARARFERLRAEQDAAFVDALECERLLRADRPAEAHAQAERLIARGVGGRLLPLLHRVRAGALAAQAAIDDAAAALRQALAEARAAGEPFEVALALEALVQLGAATDEERRERDRLIDALDVVRLSAAL